jgi:hypothetical protein
MKLKSSTMLQARLNSLMLLNTVKEIAIYLNPDDIIDDFKNSTKGGIVLL